MGQVKQQLIDEHTGFPKGFHGGYSHALDYALDIADDAETFLRAWRQGALEEWPEYYEWLRDIGVTG